MEEPSPGSFTDQQLQEHFRDCHPDTALVDWKAEPHRKTLPLRFAEGNRRVWETYHHHLHKHGTMNPVHVHIGMDSEAVGLQEEEGPDVTLIEMIWLELDAVMDQLMNPDEEGPIETTEQARGQAYGLALALAILLHSPGPPKVDAIRREAVERYRRRNA